MLWWWIHMQKLESSWIHPTLLSWGYGGGEGQAGRGAAGRASSLASLAAAEEADGVARVVGRRHGGCLADNSPPNRPPAPSDMEGPIRRAESYAHSDRRERNGDY